MMRKSVLKTIVNLFFLALLIISVNTGVSLAAVSSFDCEEAQKNSIEELICKDEVLSLLDQKLAAVYTVATKKALKEYPSVLKAEQHDWLKRRNDCGKSVHKRQCVDYSYRRRIAELRAQYRLFQAKGPFRYICDGNPRNEVVITFFNTDPPSLVAECDDGRVSHMYLKFSGSGTRYQGRVASFWEHQNKATIAWGDDSPEMRCVKKLPATKSDSAAVSQ